MKNLYITYTTQRIATEDDITNHKHILTRNVIQVGKSNLWVEQRFIDGKPNTSKIEGCKVYKIIDDNIEVGYYKKGKFEKSSLWVNENI